MKLTYFHRKYFSIENIPLKVSFVKNKMFSEMLTEVMKCGVESRCVVFLGVNLIFMWNLSFTDIGETKDWEFI